MIFSFLDESNVVVVVVAARSVTRAGLVGLSPTRSPLLKIHGAWMRVSVRRLMLMLHEVISHFSCQREVIGSGFENV